MSDELPLPLSGMAGFVGLPTFMEVRAQAEFVQLMGSGVWRLPALPGASSWSVLLIPGFMATEYSLLPLQRWFEQLGFSAIRAPVGLNAGPGHAGVDRVLTTLERLRERSDRRVLVVGHSRGGQLGTVAAVRAPHWVDAIVTLGSPLRVAHPRHFLTRLPVAGLKAVGARLMGPDAVSAEDRYEDQLEGPFPDAVERMSIWSRTDGIVDWRASLLGQGRDVEVRGSHIGLATNRRVYRALHGIAERLVAEA